MKGPITIKSPDGEPSTTVVTVGEGDKSFDLPLVSRIEWEIDPRGQAVARLTFDPVSIRAKGKVDVIQLALDLLEFGLAATPRPPEAGFVEDAVASLTEARNIANL